MHSRIQTVEEKNNHLMYTDDIKLLAKNKKELETLIHVVRIYSQDIGMEFGSGKCAMLEIWRRIQPLIGMSRLVWQFLPKSNRTAPFVELKEPLPFATLWIFLSDSGILAPSNRFGCGS